MDIDNKAFYDRLREKVGPFHQRQINADGGGMDTMIEAMEYAANGAPQWEDLRWGSYCFATAWWETGTEMQPIPERGKGKGHTYGMPAGPYKLIYYGRGLVQLTWYDNYVACTAMLQKLGYDLVDLAKDPEQALDPSISALILFYGMEQGQFSKGNTLAKYFPAGGPSDPVGARRIVNGTDRAAEIADLYHRFAYGFGVEKP